jgi:hypothetical protein
MKSYLRWMLEKICVQLFLTSDLMRIYVIWMIKVSMTRRLFLSIQTMNRSFRDFAFFWLMTQSVILSMIRSFLSIHSFHLFSFFFSSIFCYLKRTYWVCLKYSFLLFFSDFLEWLFLICISCSFVSIKSLFFVIYLYSMSLFLVILLFILLFLTARDSKQSRIDSQFDEINDWNIY